MALGNAKPTLVSIAVYVIVIVAGAVVLMFMEREGMKKILPKEGQRLVNASVKARRENLTEYTKLYIENHGSKAWTLNDASKLIEAIKRIDAKNKKPIKRDDDDENKWRREISLETFANWEYFVIVTVSTIGYGDITPISGGAKIVTVLLQVIGIPINLYMFLTIAAFLTNCISCLKNSIASRCQRRQASKPNMLCFFFCIFLAALYVGGGGIALGQSQGWKWHDSIYWSFTVAMTVGYGDIIPKNKATFAFAFFGVIFILMPVYALSQALENDEEECDEDRLMAKAEEI